MFFLITHSLHTSPAGKLSKFQPAAQVLEHIQMKKHNWMCLYVSDWISNNWRGSHIWCNYWIHVEPHHSPNQHCAPFQKEYCARNKDPSQPVFPHRNVISQLNSVCLVVVVPVSFRYICISILFFYKYFLLKIVFDKNIHIA